MVSAHCAPRYGSRVSRLAIQARKVCASEAFKHSPVCQKVSNSGAQSLRAFSLRRQGALANCRFGANPIHEDSEIRALSYRLTTRSSMRANDYLWLP